MKRARTLLAGAALLLLFEAGEPASPDVLPRAVLDAIEATPCQEATGLSPEQCLLVVTAPPPDLSARDGARASVPLGALVAEPPPPEPEPPPPEESPEP